MKQNNNVFSNSLIWLGAGISIAEIITGTLFAPLGLAKGVCAILLGHFIGFVLFFVMAYMGASSNKSSMEISKISFGVWGSKFFAILNIVQLVGWTGIMIFDGAVAANEIYNLGNVFWCVIISLLIVIWLALGIKNITKLNFFTMFTLVGLTIVFLILILKNRNNFSAITLNSEYLSFGAALELAIAMPLSWLPLVSDYTKDSSKPFTVSFASSLSYGISSTWMYIIGLVISIYTQDSNIARIIIKLGLGVLGLLIVIFSTVTTTFLDAFSAGVSSKTVLNFFNEKYFAIVVTVIACFAAMFIDLSNITNFLYFIGSVFAPMIAILISDYYVTKKNSSDNKINIFRFVVWLIVFVFYRFLMKFDFIIGYTLPTILVCFIIPIVLSYFHNKKRL
ncbi:MAG: putative hydroxymethylpyrimidine transporter CytX [Treponema sp.]|nr:putative hydroxymethylpyrimidine transporter CytX [Treponema sp.]